VVQVEEDKSYTICVFFVVGIINMSGRGPIRSTMATQVRSTMSNDRGVTVNRIALPPPNIENPNASLIRLQNSNFRINQFTVRLLPPKL